MILGIVFVRKTGCRWRDGLSEYGGPAETIDVRYHRRSQRRIWQRILARVAAAEPVPEELSLDSSHVKAHRSAQGRQAGSKGSVGTSDRHVAWRRNEQGPCSGR